ncbi:unnamed protein product [Adineta ricciae]|uniref:Uncharacterized protein n=1 Tax=Adineta ricciae TaxID=249248 RepID=A0A815EBV2_ADIRI|nr:unnamed protein product [Adineta ricciae]
MIHKTVLDSKIYVIVFGILLVLIQTILSQPMLTQSLSDNNNLKRMSSAWGKRMSSAWGKHLYQQARFNKYGYPRYPIDNEIIEQYLAQRTSNNDGAAQENMS